MTYPSLIRNTEKLMKQFRGTRNDISDSKLGRISYYRKDVHVKINIMENEKAFDRGKQADM